MTTLQAPIKPRNKISPKIVSKAFFPYLLRHWAYEVYYGGRGSTKSTYVVRKLILRCRRKRYFKCIYVRKTSESLRESSFSLLKTQIEKLGFKHEFKIWENTMRIEHIPTGNCFIAKGLDNAEKTKSLDDPNYLWCEEPTEITEDDFTTLDKAIRSPQAECSVILSFNPVMATHWLREYFFSEEDPHKPHPRFGDRLLVHRSTYKDNDFIDREAYYQKLLTTAKGRINRIRVDIDGDWGSPENLDPWLYAYDEHTHKSDTVRCNITFPIYLSFDFNRDPVTAVAFQQSPGKGTAGCFIKAVKEFGGKKQLRDLCRDIKTEYPNSILYVTGDCNGNKGDITMENRNDTYFKLIQKSLGLQDKQMHLNTSNLWHEDSRLLLNTMFANYPSIQISATGCPKLLADCEMAEVDPKAPPHKPHQLNKDRSKGHQMDYFDCLRYFFQRYYNDFFLSNYYKNK